MTNKLTSILALALLTVTAGCDGDSYPLPNSQVIIDDSIATSTEVPIRLGVDATATVASRSSGVGAIDDNFANTDVGLFCIATGHLSATGTVPAWQAGTTGRNSKSLWWNNVEGAANTAADGTTSLTWNGTVAANDERNYYPFSNYTYSFYAYHPHQDAENVTITDDEVNVSFKLDGTDDVLWAQATHEQATDAYAADAFSARYYRHGGTAIPTLSFQHKMMRLVVSVTYPKGITPENPVVKFHNQPSQATLIVATKADGHAAGTFTPDWQNDLADYTLPASNELLVAVPTEADYKYSVTVSYDYRPYATSSDVTTVTYQAKIGKPKDEDWKAGYKYIVILKPSSPTK